MPILANQSPQLLDQHQHAMDSDTRLLNISPGRLSPNLFLNLNFDNGNTLDNSNALKFEWTNFNPNPVFNKQNPGMNNLHHLENTSPSLPYEFLNGDHFNIENFRNECILNLDQNLLSHVDSGDQMSRLITEKLEVMGNEDKLAINMDLQNYSKSELLDLEKPININVINLSNEKY